MSERNGQTSKWWLNTGFGIAGVWLILLYVVFVSLVVFSLGAHQLQYAVRSFQFEEGKSLPLWAVNRIYSNWINAESELKDIEIELYEAKENLRSVKIEEQSKKYDDTILQIEYVNIVKRITELEIKIKSIEEELKIATDRLNSTIRFQNKVLSPSVGDFVNSMKFFRFLDESPIVGWMFPDFTSFPPEVLTVILVLAMGALGGTIHLTRLYLDHRGASQASQDRPASYYLFRPFLGAVTALSVYILAKAGVLVVATPSDGALEASLSPFFVSFIGIVSGLLAEQAIDTIQRAGRTWFSGSSVAAKKRWGNNLKRHVNDQNRSDMAEALNLPVAKLRGWVEEQEMVPEPMQSLIAAWLRVPERELFTDIEPRERAEAREAA